MQVHCQCGRAIDVESPFDQMVLSSNPFVRMRALCNHTQTGFVVLSPGYMSEVQFADPFEVPYTAFFTAITASIVVRELALRPDGMTLLSSWARKEDAGCKKAVVVWLVFGLKGIDRVPSWRVHLSSAAAQLGNRLYRPALLDYAVSFETFVEAFLNRQLSERYGDQVAEYVLKKTWHVEERCKEVLRLAVGHSLTEDQDLWKAWKERVQEPRNDLAHGKPVVVGQAEAEQAHQAVYQAIAWIQRLAPLRPEEALP